MGYKKQERRSFHKKEAGKQKPYGDKKRHHFDEKIENDVLWIGGRNSVTEAIETGQVEHIYIKSGDNDQRLRRLIDIAQEREIVVTQKDESELSELLGDIRHQGIVARCKPYRYADLDTVIQKSDDQTIIVLLDGVEDVRNIGAIVRTAECAGVAAVLLPKHKSAPVTAAAIKTAAGAFSYLPVCQIGNIRQTLEKLKEKGFWVVGADMNGKSLYQSNLTGPIVIVMGAEDKGMSALTRKLCDFTLSIPMKGHISSLNVSVAAAIFIYEAVRQRM